MYNLRWHSRPYCVEQSVWLHNVTAEHSDRVAFDLEQVKEWKLVAVSTLPYRSSAIIVPVCYGKKYRDV